MPAEFYTSRGFNPKVYNSEVWTTDEHGVSMNRPGGQAVDISLMTNPRANAVFYADCHLKVFFV